MLRPHHSPPPFPTRRSSDLLPAHVRGVMPESRGSERDDKTRAGSRRGTDDGCLFLIDIYRQLYGRAHGGTVRVDRKSTRLNSSHMSISYAVFCLKKKKEKNMTNLQNKNYITISVIRQLFLLDSLYYLNLCYSFERFATVLALIISFPVQYSLLQC